MYNGSSSYTYTPPTFTNLPGGGYVTPNGVAVLPDGGHGYVTPNGNVIQPGK
jgi:sugar lactone lactonase YvrE